MKYFYWEYQKTALSYRLYNESSYFCLLIIEILEDKFLLNKIWKILESIKRI